MTQDLTSNMKKAGCSSFKKLDYSSSSGNMMISLYGLVKSIESAEKQKLSGHTKITNPFTNKIICDGEMNYCKETAIKHYCNNYKDSLDSCLNENLVKLEYQYGMFDGTCA